MHLHFNGPNSVFRQVKAVRALLPVEPSQGFKVQQMPQLRSVKFEGYSQRAPTRINDLALNCTLVFSNRSTLLAKELVAFFRGRSSVYDREPGEWFWFTLTGPFGTQEIKVAEKPGAALEVTENEYNSHTLSIEVEQVFEP